MRSSYDLSLTRFTLAWQLVIVKMSRNPLAVTSTTYHHGDLRRALLDAAAEEIAAVGISALSLRELARRTGVSHAAPAHHFGDKTGLFTALAAEGFRRLHEQTAPGLERPDALAQAGIGYLRFAVVNPAHFAVMYEARLLDLTDPDLIRESSIASEVLREAVRRATGVSRDPALTTQTTAAWALVHGLATLWITGNLPYPQDPTLASKVARSIVPALVEIATASAAQL
jgi:AcrR family transcriptional regulator